MKRIIFTLLLTFAFALTTLAQSYEMTYAPDTVLYNPADYEVNLTSKIKNISSSTDSLYAEIRTFSLTQGHEVYFCWGGACFPTGTPSSSIFNTYVSLTPGQADSTFKLTLRPDNITGTSTVNMRFYNISDLNVFLDHSYVFVADPTASISSDDLARGFMLENPYPNPAEGSAWIAYQLPQQTTQAALRMTDINGRVISEQAINPFEERAQLQTAQLASGAYFVQLMAEGRVIATSRLSVK